MLNINELLSASMKGVLTAVCLMLFSACDGTVIAGSIILYALFIVIVPSIITTAIMMNKGYNGCLWFIISLFLSWIGVIIAACMTNIKRIEEQHTEMIAAIASNKGTQTVVVNDAVKEQPTPKTPLSVQPTPNYRIQAIKNLKAKGQPFDEYDIELEIEELKIAQKNQAYMPATASIQDAPPSVQTLNDSFRLQWQSMQEAPPVSETQENDGHETAEEDSYDDNIKSSTKTALWISGALAIVLMAAVGVYFYLNHNGQSYKEPALTKHVVPLRVENGSRYVQMTINGVKVDCKLDNSDRITIPVHKAAVLVKDGVIALGDFSGLGAAALSLGSFITNFDVSSLSHLVNKDVTIDLKTVQVSDKNLFLPNTKASVNLNPMSDYTVGKGIFAVFAKYNIDYQKNELVIYTKEANAATPSRTINPTIPHTTQTRNHSVNYIEFEDEVVNADVEFTVNHDIDPSSIVEPLNSSVTVESNSYSINETAVQSNFSTIKETAIREANRGRVSDGTIYKIVAQAISDKTVINNAKVSKVRFNGARQIYAVTINNEWIAKITVENNTVVVERIREGNGMYVDCNISLSNKL